MSQTVREKNCRNQRDYCKKIELLNTHPPSLYDLILVKEVGEVSSAEIRVLKQETVS